MKISIVLEGGIGDNIMATVMLRNMRKKYPDAEIYICAAWHQVLEGNPNINMLFPAAAPGVFYESFVKKSDLFYREIPYRRVPGLITHTTQQYCDFYDVPFDNNMPEIYVTGSEDRWAKNYFAQFTKPIILFQTQTTFATIETRSETSKDWAFRNWDKLIDLLKEKYQCIQIGGQHEYEVDNAPSLIGNTNLRELFALVNNCTAFISSDTVTSHIGAALRKKGVVLWGPTDPKEWGYDLHKNIVAKTSCPEQPCGRPNARGIDLNQHMDIQKIKPTDSPWWRCPTRECMRNISVDMIEHEINTLVNDIQKNK